MSKTEKLLTQLKTAQSSYPWADLVTLLGRIGYVKKERLISGFRWIDRDSVGASFQSANERSHGNLLPAAIAPWKDAPTGGNRNFFVDEIIGS